MASRNRNLDVALSVKGGRAFVSELKRGERGVRGLSTAAGRADARARASARAWGAFGTGVRTAAHGVAYAAPVIAAGAAYGAKVSIDAASDLEESVNKTGATFERHANRMLRWSEHSADALGLSQQAALEASSSVGAMLKPMGIAPRRAASMSREMTHLAADMASFNNEDPTEMLDRIRAGLSGESEPLKRFGTVLSETRVKQHAWKVGIAENGEELTEQEKILGRYSLLLKDTSDQQGDFARTSDSLANMQRQAKASVTDLSAAIGDDLLPYAKEGTEVFKNFASEAARIFDRDDLSLDDKIKLSRDAARRNFEPTWREIKDGLADANIDDALLEAFSDAVPRIAEVAGEGGGRAMLAFGKGWLRAPAWAQLMTIGFLMGKFGAFSPLGKWAGKKFAERFARESAQMLVAQQAVDNIMGSSVAGKRSKWNRLGSRGGRKFGRAFGIAAAAAAVTFFYDELEGPFNDVLEELGLAIDATDPTGGEGQRRADNRAGNRKNFSLPPRKVGKHRFPSAHPKPLKPLNQLPRAGTSGIPRIENRVFLDGKEIASSTGRHKADKKARR